MTLQVYGDFGSGNCLKVKYIADATGTPYVWHEVLARSGNGIVLNSALHA